MRSKRGKVRLCEMDADGNIKAILATKTARVFTEALKTNGVPFVLSYDLKNNPTFEIPKSAKVARLSKALDAIGMRLWFGRRKKG